MYNVHSNNKALCHIATRVAQLAGPKHSYKRNKAVITVTCTVNTRLVAHALIIAQLYTSTSAPPQSYQGSSAGWQAITHKCVYTRDLR